MNSCFPVSFGSFPLRRNGRARQPFLWLLLTVCLALQCGGATAQDAGTAPDAGTGSASSSAPAANPLKITRGGTYSGDWVSTDPAVPAVLIATDDPVVIQNATVTGPGHLIQVTGNSGANVTVNNVTGLALDPQVAGRQRGAFLVAYVMNSLVVQNCTMTGVSFGVKVGFSSPSLLQILNNQAVDLEDRASDGNGGFRAARPQLGHFALLYKVAAANGAEIGWNQVNQTPGGSSIDDVVSIYNSQGASGSPILVHDNYMEGASSPAAANYAASALNATGASSPVNAFVSFQNNQVVHTAGSGLNIGNGHDIGASGNHVVSCGQDAAGNWYAHPGTYAAILYNRVSGGDFYNNVISGTTGGLVVPNSSGQPVASDLFVNAGDLQTSSNSAGGNQFSDPCLTTGGVDLSAESGERSFWSNKLSTNGQTIGDQHSTVTVTPGASSLRALQTQQFTATVAAATSSAVTWTLSPSNGGSISSTGLYTAPASITATQTVTVTATSVANAAKSASVSVTLVPPVAVRVSPSSATLTTAQTLQFNASVANTSNTGVTWAVSPSLGSISATGLYTPPSTVSTAQAVTVTATSVADTTRSASATVTVTNSAISLTPASVTLYGGQAQQFSAVLPAGVSGAVTWSLSSSTGSIASDGTYTAPSTVSSGTSVTVTAGYSAPDGYRWNTARVVLSPPVKVNLSNGYFAITVGQTAQFTAVVQNTGNNAVTWSVSPAVGSISSSGLYSPPATIASQQTITITATSVADPTKSTTGTVVLNPPIKVAVSPASAALPPSGTVQLTASVAWSGNTSVTWSLSPSLGSIDSTGLYTAPANTTSPQTVTVTATSVADPTKSASATLTLNPPPVVTVSPGTSTLTLGQTQLFSAAVAYTTNTNVSWSISPALGSISSGGRYSPPSAAVSSPQTVTVTATSAADTTVSGSATVTVNPPVAVAVSPATTSLYASQSTQLSGNVLWNNNTNVTWSIAPAVGSISAGGVYTAPSSITSTQSVTVTASSVADTTKYATASITLLPPVKVNLATNYFAMTVGGSAQFSAQVLNAANTAVTWTISPSTGSISSNGLYTPPATITAQQTVTVTATSVADPSKSATGSVLLNPPVSVAVVPAAITLTRSHVQQFTANVSWSNNTAVTWSMSPQVGTLSSTGQYTVPDTVNANQTVMVTATSVADPTKSASATVSLLTLIGPAPITITEGGTYSGNWVSNDPGVAAVTINTDQPVTIQNSTVKGRGHLIRITGNNGANVTVQNVTGTGLDPQVSGAQRGAFVKASAVNTLSVSNCTIAGTSFGVMVSLSPNMTSLSVLRNTASGLEDRTSDGSGGFTTSRPVLGHFFQVSTSSISGGAEVAWNQVQQTIGTTSTEDVFNIYKAQGASGYPIHIHDNYMEGYSSPAVPVYTGNGMITDGDASNYSGFVLFEDNQMVHTAGGGVAIASGHDVTAKNNRVVSCGKDSSGNVYSTGGIAAYLGDYYGASNFYNNSITGTAGGLIAPNALGVLAPADLYAKPADLQGVNNSVAGNHFTDPCLVNGVIDATAEDTERKYWSGKLSTNSIALGDQH